MALPQVDLKKGSLSWTPPTQNTDGTPVTSGEISGYIIGIRSLTQTGSVQGTYPIQVNVGSTSVSEALNSITPMLQPDSYAVVIKTVGASGYGTSDWTNELQFQGTFPTPNPPSALQVG